MSEEVEQKKEKMLKKYPDLIAALGTKTDTALRGDFGISHITISKLRLLFGVPTYHTTQFNSFPIEELGTAPDRVLAEKYKVSVPRIAALRKKMGVPHYKNSKSTEQQDPGYAADVVSRIRRRVETRHPGLLEQLSHRTDVAIGKEYGLCRERVRQFREALSLPSYAQTHPIGANVPVVELGTMSDRALAQKYGMTVPQAFRLRTQAGIAPFYNKYKEDLWASRAKLLEGQLGEVSDTKLAYKFHLTLGQVARARENLGIPPVRTSSHDAGRNKLDPERVRALYLEGKTDREIGAELGFAEGTIAIKRHKMQLFLIRYKRKASTSEAPYRKNKWSNRDWSQVDPLIGTAADRTIAYQVGMMPYVVRARRLKLGIPPFGRNYGKN